MLLSLLLACATLALDAPTPVDGAAAPVPPLAQPVWTADQTATAIESALASGVPLPSPALDLWFDLLSHGTEDCPGGAYQEGVLTALAGGGCTAPTGYRFSGAGLGARGWSDSDSDGVDDTWTEELKADGQIRDPEGAAFFFGGAMSLTLSGTREAGGPFIGEVLGTYRYEHAENTWLRAGTSTATYVSGSIAGDGSFRFQGDGGFAVGQAALVMVDLQLGGVCGDNPTGGLGIRDPDGRWVDLTYDDATCDGCGKVVFDGRIELGSACTEVREPFVTAMAHLAARAGIGAGP